MRETIRISIAAVILTSTLRLALAQGGIPWRYDLYEAQQMARQQQRLILIHFYSDTCGPCQRLEQSVFPNPNVYRALAMDYIPVKINGERARDIAMQYQVDRWPTDVITDCQGRVLYKTVSPQDPARYAQLLNAVSADSRARNAAEPVAGRTPWQGDPGLDARNANFGNRLDPRSQFAAYTPASAQNGPPGSPLTGPYAAQAANPADLVNPYVVPSDATSTARASAGAYDPRSAWSAAGSEHASGYASAVPPEASPSGYSPSQPAWQENRFFAAPAVAEPAQPAAPQAAPARGASSTPLAMDGFCPVTLAEQERWVKGDSRWGAVHRGRTYLFLSQQHQHRFLTDPDRFSPVLSGYDPVRYIDRGELVPGQRRHGMWFRGKIYLFADEESLNRFSATPQMPDVYAQRTQEIMVSAGPN